MAFSALGAPIGGWFTPATSHRIGMLAFSAAMTGIIIAVTSGRLRLFIAATAFTVVAAREPSPADQHQHAHPPGLWTPCRERRNWEEPPPGFSSVLTSCRHQPIGNKTPIPRR